MLYFHRFRRPSNTNVSTAYGKRFDLATNSRRTTTICEQPRELVYRDVDDAQRRHNDGLAANYRNGFRGVHIEHASRRAAHEYVGDVTLARVFDGSELGQMRERRKSEHRQ